MKSTLKTLSLFILLIGSGWLLSAQNNPEEAALKAVIDKLFDGMRNVDSTIVQPIFTEGAIISSVIADAQGNARKVSNYAAAFITTLGTPRENQWNEVIWSYKFNIDGAMAYVWTEYSFFLDDNLSHCGVNMFEMLKIQGQWKISSITDTRRNVNCYTAENINIHRLVDAWHQAAKVADERIFFGLMASDAVYIGTDPKERWTKTQMIADLGKFFEGESAWAFTPISRSINVHQDNTVAWFDELLDTWMGTCRGSGVLRKNGNNWQIVHYHLSIAVPNEQVNNYLELIGKERPKK